MFDVQCWKFLHPQPPGTGTGAGRISGLMEPPGLKPLLPPPQVPPPPPPQPGLDSTGAIGLMTGAGPAGQTKETSTMTIFHYSTIGTELGVSLRL